MICILATDLTRGQLYVVREFTIHQVRGPNGGVIRKESGELEEFRIYTKEEQLRGVEITSLFIVDKYVKAELIALAKTRLRSPGERKKTHGNPA